MNCQSFENSLTDLARQHPFEAMALREALAHAESCPTCTLRLEEQRALTLGLSSLAEQTKRLETPNRVEGRLMEAFREAKLQPQRIHATTPSWFAVAAIAATSNRPNRRLGTRRGAGTVRRRHDVGLTGVEPAMTSGVANGGPDRRSVTGTGRAG